jgi:hypothetical protein
MNKWLPIDPKEFREEIIEKKTNDLKINLFLSPYDIPEAVSGDFDESRRLFVIKFKYLTEETLESKKYDDCITLSIGKNSQRLYEILVNVNEFSVKKIGIGVFVKQAIEKYESQDRSPVSRKGLNIARKVLARQGQEIFQSYSHAV